MTGSWVFLQLPSPSPPPRRRKGRGRSNRSDVPVGGRRRSEEEETVPVSRVTGPMEAVRGAYYPCPKNWKLLLLYRQMLVSDICLTFKATVEQDGATWLLPWREIYIGSRIIVYYKSCLLHLNWTFKC